MAKISGSWKFHLNVNYYPKNILQNIKCTSYNYKTTYLTHYDGVELAYESSDDSYWLSYYNLTTGDRLYICEGHRELNGLPDYDARESLIINFGPQEQEVSDDFLTMIQTLCDPVPALKGKYVVSIEGLSKLSGYYDYDNMDILSGGCLVEYTNMIGEGFSEIERLDYYSDETTIHRTMYLAGCVFDESGLISAEGDYSNKEWKILDFGDWGQGVPEDFYNTTLQYVLLPAEENAFVDAAGLSSIVNGIRSQVTDQITTAYRAALPTTATLMAYNASGKTQKYTITNGADYEILFLCVTPGTTATQIFLTLNTTNIAPDETIQIDAPDNTNTTRFSVWKATDGRIVIQTAAGYNNSAGSASPGYIRGIWGMKIGG